MVNFSLHLLQYFFVNLTQVQLVPFRKFLTHIFSSVAYLFYCTFQKVREITNKCAIGKINPDYFSLIRKKAVSGRSQNVTGQVSRIQNKSMKIYFHPRTRFDNCSNCFTFKDFELFLLRVAIFSPKGCKLPSERVR